MADQQSEQGKVSDSDAQLSAEITELKRGVTVSRKEHSQATTGELRSLQQGIVKSYGAKIEKLGKQIDLLEKDVVETDVDGSRFAELTSLRLRFQSYVDWATRLSHLMGILHSANESVKPLPTNFDSRAIFKNAHKSLAMYDQRIASLLTFRSALLLKFERVKTTRQSDWQSAPKASELVKQAQELQDESGKLQLARDALEAALKAKPLKLLPEIQAKSLLSTYDIEITRVRRLVRTATKKLKMVLKRTKNPALIKRAEENLSTPRTDMAQLLAEKEALQQAMKGYHMSPSVAQKPTLVYKSEPSPRTVEGAKQQIEFISAQRQKLDDKIVETHAALETRGDTATNFATIVPNPAGFPKEQPESGDSVLTSLLHERQRATVSQSLSKAKLTDLPLKKTPSHPKQREPGLGSNEITIQAELQELPLPHRKSLANPNWSSATYQAMKTEIGGIKSIIANMASQANSATPEPSMFHETEDQTVHADRQMLESHAKSTPTVSVPVVPDGMALGVGSPRNSRLKNMREGPPESNSISSAPDPPTSLSTAPPYGKLWKPPPVQKGASDYTKTLSSESDFVSKKAVKASLYTALKSATHILSKVDSETIKVDTKALLNELFPQPRADNLTSHSVSEWPASDDAAPDIGAVSISTRQHLVETAKFPSSDMETLSQIAVSQPPIDKTIFENPSSTLGNTEIPTIGTTSVDGETAPHTKLQDYSSDSAALENKILLNEPVLPPPAYASSEVPISEVEVSTMDLANGEITPSTTDLARSPLVEVDTGALLAELFPQEASKQMPRDVQAIELPVPRLPLPIEESERLITYREGAPKRVELVPPGRWRDIMTVLELQSGNVSLTEDDFRRLTPKGKHMKEWSVGGEFTKVFPRRNPWTLQRELPGNYYMIFPSTTSARAYLEHIRDVHKLARQYTPTSLASPIAPPPGYLIDGVDVHNLIKNFTLVAPTSQLIVNTYTIGPGFHPYKANLFKRGGYSEIVSEGRDRIPQVKLRMLHGPQPTYFEITDAIGKSSSDRNLSWALLDRADHLRKLDMDRYARDHSQDEADWDAEERAARVAKYQQPEYGQVWVLAFQNMESAKSFVRCWHRRPFPWKKKHEIDPLSPGSKYGHQVTMVEAELLW
jgi:hypothetical protein